MTTVYVANCTRQAHQFLYQVPEFPAPFMQPIPPGGQIKLSKDLNPIQLDAVVGHHRKYGMVHVDEVARARQFSGLCYSTDKPIKLDRIQELITRNDRVLEDRGRKLRAAAAVAVNAQIENNMFERNMPGTLNEFEMSAVEEDRGDRPDDIEPVAEGVRVTRDAVPAANRRRGRRTT
jgi:hypothetical protein